MADDKPIWEGAFAGHTASVRIVKGVAEPFIADNPHMFRGTAEGIMETAVRELAAERDELRTTLVTIGRNICDALNDYRVQPAKAQPPVEALKQLLKWVDMKRAERDEEERRRVAAQNDNAVLRERIAVLEAERKSLCDEFAEPPENLRDAFVEAVNECFHAVCALNNMRGQIDEEASAYAEARELRSRLSFVEDAARTAVATHNECRVSTEHSGAIWKLKELIGDDNG